MNLRDSGGAAGHWWQTKKGLLTIACGTGFVVAYGVGKLAPPLVPYAFVAAMLVGLAPIARRAVMAALAGTPFSIEMLMTITAVGAVIINAAKEAAAVVFLFLVGKMLEGVAASKARASIQSLTALLPKTERFIDRFLGYYTPAVVAVAALVAVVPPLALGQVSATDTVGRHPPKKIAM